MSVTESTKFAVNLFLILSVSSLFNISVSKLSVIGPKPVVIVGLYDFLSSVKLSENKLDLSILYMVIFFDQYEKRTHQHINTSTHQHTKFHIFNLVIQIKNCSCKKLVSD